MGKRQAPEVLRIGINYLATVIPLLGNTGLSWRPKTLQVFLTFEWRLAPRPPHRKHLML